MQCVAAWAVHGGAICECVCNGQDLAEKLRDATPEPVSVPEVQELQERCAALAGTNAELDAALAREVSQLAFAGAQLQQAWRTENALKSANLELAAAAEEGRERVAELEGANAELASQLDTMQQESVALGAAAAIHSCELAAAREAAAAELADALEVSLLLGIVARIKGVVHGRWQKAHLMPCNSFQARWAGMPQPVPG